MEAVWNNVNMVAEVELVYKTKVKPSLRPVIRQSKDAYEIFKKSWDENKIEFVEQFKILLLNNGRKVLGIYELPTGGLCATIADPRLIFTAALKANATSIILAHNHPSGNLKASREDEALTRNIVQCGRLLHIDVSDHLIITTEGYLSFADEGLL